MNIKIIFASKVLTLSCFPAIHYITPPLVAVAILSVFLRVKNTTIRIHVKKLLI